MLNLGAGLEGKGVIVTGAAGGIGREVVKSFAAVGAKVLAVDVDVKRTAEALEGVEGDGHLAVGDDLTDLASHGRLVGFAEERLGGVRAFAHLAAVLKRRARLDDVTEEDFDLQVGTNLKASFFLTRAVADSMIAAGTGGAIILFSSQGWWTGGFGGSVVYNATKGAIVTMTRGLARTLGPEKITVNSVAPGQVETSMLLTDLDPAIYERMKRDTPLGYVAQPSEIAGTVVFLASDHARYISGATVNVSGGFLMY